jgi:hypothetical protein
MLYFPLRHKSKQTALARERETHTHRNGVHRNFYGVKSSLTKARGRWFLEVSICKEFNCKHL